MTFARAPTHYRSAQTKSRRPMFSVRLWDGSAFAAMTAASHPSRRRFYGSPRFNRRDDIIVQFEFDEAKSVRNRETRGIGFERFGDMAIDRAIGVEDVRADYGERRVRFYGPIDGQLHVAVVTNRGERVRVISLRRANRREERMYAEVFQSS